MRETDHQTERNVQLYGGEQRGVRTAFRCG